VSATRNRIEKWFEKFSLTIFRFRWATILIVLVFVGGLASWVPKITFDTSNESFLHEKSKTLQDYNAFRDQFGRDDLIIIAIGPTDVFNLRFLEKLKIFHENLRDDVPHVEEITSLINARNTRGENDALIVGDLLENWPENQHQLETLKKRVMGNPLYLNRLISENAQFTTLVIKTETYSNTNALDDPLAGFDENDDSFADDDTSGTLQGAAEKQSPVEKIQYLTDEEISETVYRVKSIAKKYQDENFEIYIAGPPVVSSTIKRLMIRDQKLFMRMIVLTIAIGLFVMFRRISAVVLPMIVVACALVSTLGLMAIFKVPLKTPTTVLPSFILAVGIADSIHILTLYYRHLAMGGDRKQAIQTAMGHSALAVVLTTLTTAAGLSSFGISKVAPIAELGIFAAVGVMLALIFTLILLPALLAAAPAKAIKSTQASSGKSTIDGILMWVGRFSTRNAIRITITCSLLLILSLVAASRLSFTHDVLKWLPETEAVRISTETIDHSLKGSVAMEVIVDTGRANGLYDIHTLDTLEQLAREIENIRQDDLFVGKASSVVDILKEIHQALNENRSEYYVVPRDPALIPQELLLFENSGSDDLEDVVDSQFQKARFTIKVPWLDAVKYVALMEDLSARFDRAFGKDITVSMTGMMTIMFSTVVSAIHSAAQSYVIAGLVITVMVILLIGSLKLGLLAMFPNMLAILFIMGLMAVFKLPFDMFTMLIGSIAIGLSVDNTIHFMHNFRRYYRKTGNVEKAVERTLLTSGRALFITTAVLSIGFFIYTFASMKNLFFFGLLTGLAIALALVTNFFLTPALMALVARFADLFPREVGQNENL